MFQYVLYLGEQCFLVCHIHLLPSADAPTSPPSPLYPVHLPVAQVTAPFWAASPTLGLP